MKQLAPICLFVYNRLEALKSTVMSLSNNVLASESDLFIFSDGPKNEVATDCVLGVREYIKTIAGFRSVTIIESMENKGLANSIIDGVTQIINKYDKVIVLEDDLVTSPNFLSFINEALDYYEANLQIFSIAGYTTKIENAEDDIYFTLRASSWGWGTWKDRWNSIDWNLDKEYNTFIKDRNKKKQFNQMGSDMTKMLRDQMNGKINSWAIRWCYNQFLQNKYTVYPTISKVNNVGTDQLATNTKDHFNRFYTPLDTSLKVDFKFSNEIVLNKQYLSQFLKQYTIFNRIKYKILNMFFS